MNDRLKLDGVFRFGLAGACSTGIDFVIYMFLSLKIPLTISKGIAMTISSIFSYIVNKRFTFENNEQTNTGYLMRFYLVFFANMGINLSVTYLSYKATGNKLMAYAMATACGMIVNYLGQRFYVFRMK